MARGDREEQQEEEERHTHQGRDVGKVSQKKRQLEHGKVQVVFSCKQVSFVFLVVSV